MRGHACCRIAPFVYVEVSVVPPSGCKVRSMTHFVGGAFVVYCDISDMHEGACIF